MYQFPIGAMLESFKLPTAEALKKASEIGVSGIQMYATKGEHAPENMTPAKIKELKDMMTSNGLVFSALCGDLGHGFGHADLNPALVEKSKRIVDLALELGTNVVTTHIGVVPSDKSNPRYAVMQDACSQLAEYADSVGAHFAIETGPELSATLCSFLDGLGSTGVGVNLDPANLAMVVGENAVNAVRNLKKYIVHTHAKDGNMLVKGDPEQIYGVTPMPEDMKNISFFEEVPLGTGSVDFPAYLRALDEIGYRGFLTIERECGDNPAADIALAADFLKKVEAEG
ncbi:MAG: sugar phosphate isomerase/epimerase [Firmicutes bacterium]|nr:sugar phosphate isomerase/epimerase [Candidatus Colimorpha enterica]